MFQVGAFDGPDRDPRLHAISIAFVALIDQAALAEPSSPMSSTAVSSASRIEIEWTRYDSSAPLPFDHDAIVAEAIRQVRTRLWHDDEVTGALTGPWFSTPDAVRLTAGITATPVHQSNLRRSLASHPRLRSATAPDTGRPGRRPLVWEWT